ncbi:MULTISPECIES: AAA family ATPase [unclassified Ketobacter]|uniref:AAA family ATPase n=1 Tax=unclassified Ketobacter TaxID=2639109 RepID=UPI000F127B32|nr:MULTISPECIES: AAA family ATPase [unclassified Ketobacter]MCK5791957.1 ATP-dependent Clp protease ATP-binding subunit [Ketobacter sp.]MEC8812552.1 AAA family ATPase [Pseudomonadota bacterium]RLT90573.1 MAG: ATP-dependent Clp protease ATP-binding subunit [Ketobacter sp. GenoA1]RLT99671.1 MAG: ATP-dependent Clp protease ATP-binding subunit [Ketobacter sp.]
MPFINEVLEHNRIQHEVAQEVKRSTIAQSRFAFEPQTIADALRARIVGQDHVVESLCQQLNVVKAGLADSRRPLLVMLMLGNTGVGKTEMVRLLAESIHGDAAAFCRIDMNTLSQSHYSAAITGAPPGYVGSKENTTLINEELILGSASRPGIVLFDEVEKASQEVARSLMNVFDNGRLRLASGTRELSFSNCLVFMTSNLGAQQWQRRQAASPWQRWFLSRRQSNRQAHFEAALAQHFDPEFLNRIDRIELFAPIGTNHVRQIVELEVRKLNQHLAKKQIVLQVEPGVIELLAQRGFDPQYGARALRRCVRDQLLVPLSSSLLAGGALAPANPGAAGRGPSRQCVVSLQANGIHCHLA